MILERRILEEKILTLKEQKFNRIKESKEKLGSPDLIKRNKKTEKQLELKMAKERELKEKCIRDERLRLHNEAVHKRNVKYFF